MVQVQPRRTARSGILSRLFPPTTEKQSLPTSKSKRKKRCSLNLILLSLLTLILIKFWFVTINTATTTTATIDIGSSLNAQTIKDQKAMSNEQYDKLKMLIGEKRSEFDLRYGGKESASTVLSRGIHTFHENEDVAIENTAKRILRAAASKKKEFVLSFGGYSVTVGRGNLFEQSFPFVIERILTEPLKEIGINIVVRNAAIGGIPSFPYGWCLSNFLGDESDLVSWDYGMNEGNSAEAFEAYVRHAMLMPHQPMVLMLDTKKPRMDVLAKYTHDGFLADPIAVGKGEVVQDLLGKIKEEKDRPPGLQEWDVWGAPKGSPGQSKWHPKKMEHELIGWMIAVHLLKSVEMAGEIMMKEKDWRTLYGSKDDVEKKGGHERDLPKPVTSFIARDDGKSATSIMHGVPLASSNSNGQHQKWRMNSVSCRTSFLPAMDGTLESIVVSGVAQASSTSENDIMSSRDDDIYSSGWVVDIGKVERDTKRKVAKFGGLGYIDMKTALYGVPESGTVRFWLPYEGSTHLHSHDDSHYGDANHWFGTLVVCEVNEKRTEDECKMESDLLFSFGGVASPSVVKIEDAAAYLGKKICVSVKIPGGTSITMRKDIVPPKDVVSVPQAARMFHDEGHDDDIGLLLDVAVTGKGVSQQKGACSISHIVWEQH